MATSDHKRVLKIGFVAKYMGQHRHLHVVFEALKSAACTMTAKWRLLDRRLQIRRARKRYRPGTKAVRWHRGARRFRHPRPGRQDQGRSIRAKVKKALFGALPGLQMAVIAAARNAGLTGATTFELDDQAADQVIITMDDQVGKHMTGGTCVWQLRLRLEKGSLAAKAYGVTDIVERHRHRGECNNKYRDQYEKKWGIRASGINPIIICRNHRGH